MLSVIYITNKRMYSALAAVLRWKRWATPVTVFIREDQDACQLGILQMYPLESVVSVLDKNAEKNACKNNEGSTYVWIYVLSFLVDGQYETPAAPCAIIKKVLHWWPNGFKNISNELLLQNIPTADQ